MNNGLSIYHTKCCETTFHELPSIAFIRGLKLKNCFEGQMRTYKITRGLHYDADATTAVPELYCKQLLHLIPGKR